MNLIINKDNFTELGISKLREKIDPRLTLTGNVEWIIAVEPFSMCGLAAYPISSIFQLAPPSFSVLKFDKVISESITNRRSVGTIVEFLKESCVAKSMEHVDEKRLRLMVSFLKRAIRILSTED